MAQKRTESSTGRIRVGDLLSLETALLTTLCQTINAPGSELKYKILDTLSEEDFYFPINKVIFSILIDLHQRGEYVVFTNLDEELRKRSVSIPEDFFMEDLFRGSLPGAAELDQWLAQIKERAASGVSPVPNEPAEPSEAAPSTPERAPAPAPMPAAAPPPSRPAASSQARPAAETRRPSELTEPRRKTSPTGLYSEAEEWSGYLDKLASRQGKSFDTGFSGLDQAVGGLGPCLMILADTDADRLCGFLKQLADQVAERSGLPCLFLSFEQPKDVLRIRTLARLAGVTARDLEKGRLKRDSPEWLKVEEAGRRAAEWLKWVFVVEADAEMGIGLLRDLCQRLITSSGEPTCLVAVDSLEKLGKGSESLRSAVAELKKLSQSLDVLVVAATATTALLADRAVDISAVLREGEGAAVELEVLRAGQSQSKVLHFDYLRSVYRFVEQPARPAAAKS